MFKGKVAEMKSKLVDKEMYMYLVDEYTSEPVYDPSGVYPKVRDERSESRRVASMPRAKASRSNP
jgi:hypothetical protein